MDRRKRQWTEAEYERIRDMRAQKYSWSEIAWEMHCNETTIVDIGRSLGLTRPKAAPKQYPNGDVLRAMWDEGLSASEIGRRLGVTKNVVIGQAHRMGLPARPSPIVDAKPVATSSTAAPYRPTMPGCEVIPAGHPLTWSLLTAGTVLEGEPYPCP